MKRIEIFENGIYLTFEITDEEQIKLLHFSALPFRESSLSSAKDIRSFLVNEPKLVGHNCPEKHHGSKCSDTVSGYSLKFKDFSDTSDVIGRLITVVQSSEPSHIETVTCFRFFTGIPMIRTWTVIRNSGSEPQTLEYVSAFTLNGIEKEGSLPQDEKMLVGICRNSQQRELQWQTYTLPDLGLKQTEQNGSLRFSKTFGVTNVGDQSENYYIPVGYIENTETGSALVFRIEHNDSAHWEIGESEGHLYLRISGTGNPDSNFQKQLGAGESFETVPVEIGAVKAGDGFSAFDKAVAALTRCRRALRRRNIDNERMPVIFNDCMNRLCADLTAEKEYQLIDAAAETGCEYFCIDAGRYGDSLKTVADYIRSKGMIPGISLELEALGIGCTLDETAPDFRDPLAAAHADGVIDRLVYEFGIGYIKLDYSMEINADSCGCGLIENKRAYIAWLDRVFERHHKLVIENCSSGVSRMDGALLSRCQLQSVSVQEDHRKYCTLAANSPLAVCPEQSAVRSYLVSDGDREKTVFNMINAMLLRIQLSGDLADTGHEGHLLVKEALGVYRKIRRDIRAAVPLYPIGVSHFDDEWTCLGMYAERRIYLAVWRREGTENTLAFRLPILDSRKASAECIYPSFANEELTVDGEEARVTFEKEYTARLFRIIYE